MVKLTKKQRSVADAIIKMTPDAPTLLQMTEDEFFRVLDDPRVRDFIRQDRERQIFISAQEAIHLLRTTLKGPQPGQRTRNLTAAEQKACEFALKLNGLTGQRAIEDKGSSGVDDFIDPTPVAN